MVWGRGRGSYGVSGGGGGVVIGRRGSRGVGLGLGGSRGRVLYIFVKEFNLSGQDFFDIS